MDLSSFIIGAIGGFFTNSLAMKISFKKLTLKSRISSFNSILTIWQELSELVMKRHVLLTTDQRTGEFLAGMPTKLDLIRNLHAQSRKIISQLILNSANEDLTTEIKEFNNRFFEDRWDTGLDEAAISKLLGKYNNEILTLSYKMNNDIRNSSHLSLKDICELFHIRNK